ncbi:hypothetical protein C8R46DRAFT_1026639 [Mycena filopes]|nr:hypothetical protein C8R46DRAFT_1026639 [Mycena filopes]
MVDVSSNKCRDLIVWQPNPFNIMPLSLAEEARERYRNYSYYYMGERRQNRRGLLVHHLDLTCQAVHCDGCYIHHGLFNSRGHEQVCQINQLHLTDGEGVERVWAEGCWAGGHSPQYPCLLSALTVAILLVLIRWTFGAQRDSCSSKKWLSPTRRLGLQRTVAAARPPSISTTAAFSAVQFAARPLHMLREWTGSFWETITLEQLGLVYQLGHRGRTCASPSAQTSSMHIFDTAGVQKVQYRYCNCAEGLDEAEQLLDAGWHRAAAGSNCCQTWALLAQIAKLGI